MSIGSFLIFLIDKFCQENSECEYPVWTVTFS